MNDDERKDLVNLIYDCPRDIAWKLGYDKLTDLHNEWIKDMVFGSGDKTLQAHRGSFKTTCLIIAIAFILILFPAQRVIFIRKTDGDVAEVMNAVANILRNPYFSYISRMLYGVTLVLTKDTQGEVSTNIVLGVSGASQLVGLGCGGSITGKHADRIFTDDIVNVKDRVSGAERERIKLLYQELQNIRNRGGRIFNTGTPWHKNDAFTLMPNIVRFDCYSTGLMTREEIQSIRKGMSPSLYAANYELKHIADTEAMFSEPSFFDDPRLLYDGVCQIDAAYGGEDGTAFTVAKKVGDRYRMIGRLWPKHVDDCIEDILSIHESLRLGTIYCESNADKGYLAKKLRKLGVPCIDYPESMNKYIKISTHLRAAWSKVSFLDCDEYPLDADYLDQIIDYTENAAHDDAPDSCASLVRQLESRPKLNPLKGRL
nr:MAG: terminase large subunit [Caudoviricetes sp.]UCW36538.1 MAG: terminase large subunit [Caudoviricetes sp.]